MKITFENILEQLKTKNIRLSHQRLKVLEFLVNNRIHPTVDQIFSQLRKEIPTLSKTTVYNTLDTLVEVGIVKVITIEDNETRYDIDTETHGHFKCESCGTIYDFVVNIDSFNIKDLEGFKIYSREVYFKGICKNCVSQNKND